MALCGEGRDRDCFLWALIPATCCWAQSPRLVWGVRGVGDDNWKFWLTPTWLRAEALFFFIWKRRHCPPTPA